MVVEPLIIKSLTLWVSLRHFCNLEFPDSLITVGAPILAGGLVIEASEASFLNAILEHSTCEFRPRILHEPQPNPKNVYTDLQSSTNGEKQE
jgi:hypothetical protein